MQENAHAGNVTAPSTRSIAAALVVSAAVFLLDQQVKQWLWNRSDLMTGEWLGGLIRFTDHRNYGISFNIPVPTWMIIVISIVALLWALRELFKFTIPSTQRMVFLGIFIGGVLGNLFDRITLGFVRDWLLLWGHSAVNVADGSILLGLIPLLIPLTKRPKK